MSSKGPKNIKDAAEAYEHMVTAGKDQVEKVVKAGSDAAEKVLSLGRDRLQSVAKGYQELAEINQRGLSAVMAAGNAAAKGVEALNAELLAFAKSRVEENIGQVKALAGVKTMADLMDLQSEYVRSSFDAYVQASTKVGEMTAKVAQEALEPINAELQSAWERFGKLAA
jgi:phasin family protein